MIVTVASGKGGTGKTTIATNLALAMKDKMPVQVLDCDVEEPNSHLYLHPEIDFEEEVTIPVPEVNLNECDSCGECSKFCAYNAIAVAGDKAFVFPDLCHGCGGCMLTCPQGAITEKPYRIGVVAGGQVDNLAFVHGKIDIGKPLAPPLVREVKRRAWENGLIIIDAAPGTSCPVVAAVKNSDFCLLVTEPTPFGLNDLKLAVGMVRQLGINMGVVINRDIPGYLLVEDYCREEQIPVLLKIPFEKKYAAVYAKGRCLVQDYPEWLPAFKELYEKIERLVS